MSSLQFISKYSDFNSDSGMQVLKLELYDCSIKFGKLNSDFTGLSINGKYEKMEVNAGSVPFRVDFNIKYPKADIPESVKISK